MTLINTIDGLIWHAYTDAQTEASRRAIDSLKVVEINEDEVHVLGHFQPCSGPLIGEEVSRTDSDNTLTDLADQMYRAGATLFNDHEYGYDAKTHKIKKVK